MDGWVQRARVGGISSGPRSPTDEEVKTLDYVNVVVNLINDWWTVHQQPHDPELNADSLFVIFLYLSR